MAEFLAHLTTARIAWADGPGWTLAILAAALAAPAVGALCAHFRRGAL